MVYLWEKYFRNVRWVELFLSMAIAGGLYLSTKLKKASLSDLTQADWVEAAGAALGAGATYLRIPKGEEAAAQQEAQDRAEADYPLNLPPKIDPTLEVIKSLVARGMPEGAARIWAATDFEAAARYAKDGTK